MDGALPPLAAGGRGIEARSVRCLEDPQRTRCRPARGCHRPRPGCRPVRFACFMRRRPRWGCVRTWGWPRCCASLQARPRRNARWAARCHVLDAHPDRIDHAQRSNGMGRRQVRRCRRSGIDAGGQIVLPPGRLRRRGRSRIEHRGNERFVRGVRGNPDIEVHRRAPCAGADVERATESPEHAGGRMHTEGGEHGCSRGSRAAARRGPRSCLPRAPWLPGRRAVAFAHHAWRSQARCRGRAWARLLEMRAKAVTVE